MNNPKSTGCPIPNFASGYSHEILPSRFILIQVAVLLKEYGKREAMEKGNRVLTRVPWFSSHSGTDRASIQVGIDWGKAVLARFKAISGPSTTVFRMPSLLLEGVFHVDWPIGDVHTAGRSGRFGFGHLEGSSLGRIMVGRYSGALGVGGDFVFTRRVRFMSQLSPKSKEAR